MTTRQATPRNALEPPRPPAGATPVIATDFDRTFTQADLTLSGESIQKARELRRSGACVILVTGRRAAQLPVHALRGCFDAMVLEGGAIWGRPGNWTIPPTSSHFWGISEALQDSGHDVIEGWASFSAPLAAEQTLRANRGDVTAMRNVDRIDVTPFGVDKASGLMRSLDGMRLTKPWVLAVGDGANDVPLAILAHASVAVANADPLLIEQADVHAPYPSDRGFLWAVGGVEDSR